MKEKQRPVANDPLQLLSVVIPCRDEATVIRSTVQHLYLELGIHNVPHEIVAVDDGSSDSTWQVLQELAATTPTLRPVKNIGEHGFGRAVVLGFDESHGDAVVVMMADESDDCRDVVRYWQVLCEGWDAAFGSRFIRGGGVIDYPGHKLAVNRVANTFLRLLFKAPFNDFTNAFKGYRRTALDGCRPFLSPQFNLTIELPLKIVVRGVLLENPSNYLEEQAQRDLQVEIDGDGEQISFYCAVLLVGEVLQQGRLCQERTRRFGMNAKRLATALCQSCRLLHAELMRKSTPLRPGQIRFIKGEPGGIRPLFRPGADGEGHSKSSVLDCCSEPPAMRWHAEAP